MFCSNQTAPVAPKEEQMRRPRRNHTPAFKAKVALAAIKGEKTLDFRWHDLRHTFASWHAQNGTPVHVLQALGGWRDPAMVQRYAHLSMEHLEGYSARYAEQAKLSELSGYYSSTTGEGEATRAGRATH
jgi:integrase